MTLGELQVLLRKVAELKLPKWRRDHCAIYCGFFFGLRISEAVILARDTFRDLKSGEAHIRTKKQGVRAPYTCDGCNRKFRVAAARAGQEHTCTHCGAVGKIKLPANMRGIDTRPPEKSPPVVETAVVNYVQDYLEHCMREDQTWLLESAPGQHLHPQSLRRIFSHYLMASGLPKVYGWHSLRHGRGVLLLDEFDDLVMVRDGLRQKSLSAAEFYIHLSPKKLARYTAALDKVTEGMDFGVTQGAGTGES